FRRVICWCVGDHARARLAPRAVRCCNGTPPAQRYTLSLHDALPICCERNESVWQRDERGAGEYGTAAVGAQPDVAVELSAAVLRSEEHTSELQSRANLVCRRLLEKKKD